ncbi:hypothetical protein R1sor_025896 [Riccia sorocarpa]|uniref:Reverse transcriptase domain-containing protein n=1 Tax=Riccia sorocarpa TaxID=122646 RepID=A0ABD3G9W7_9MARC
MAASSEVVGARFQGFRAVVAQRLLFAVSLFKESIVSTPSAQLSCVQARGYLTLEDVVINFIDARVDEEGEDSVEEDDNSPDAETVVFLRASKHLLQLLVFFQHSCLFYGWQTYKLFNVLATDEEDHETDEDSIDDTELQPSQQTRLLENHQTQQVLSQSAGEEVGMQTQVPVGESHKKQDSALEKRKRDDDLAGEGLQSGAGLPTETPSVQGVPSSPAPALQQNSTQKSKNDRRRWVIDFTIEGKAGAVLILCNNWKIQSSGVRGDGSVAWASLQTGNGEINIASIHGPTDREERADLWEWMRDNLKEGTWFLAGDWNTVESHEDSVGDNPIQRGREKAAWSDFKAALDLQAAWYFSSSRFGPRYTRQRLAGDRLEQARLDRVYFSGDATWTEYQGSITHDAAIKLSDHHPVIFDLQKRTKLSTKRSTYFKVKPELLTDPEVKQKLLATWKEAASDIQDERIKWELKWRASRTFLRQAEADKRQQQKQKQSKLQELQTVRERVAAEKKSLPDEELLKLEAEVAQLELQKAEHWRRLSRTKWIQQGDAPSSFFFSLLKVKQANEDITKLKKDDGTWIESEEEIMAELHKYYAQLFQPEPESEDSLQLRQDVLATLNRRVTESQNADLISCSSDEDIHEDTIRAVHGFWSTGELPHTQKRGCIKLIPKGDDRFLISSWRPISLLNLGYKINSKLLANKLNVVLEHLVGNQQKGFVKGRSIIDNILNYQLGQDWAFHSKQPALFIKLDFQKAFDRISHVYLISLLHAMNFHQDFINLVEGLIKGASSLIHTSGRFSEDFQIGRGVRQGCPLAPLLFSLATQPLIQLLEEAQRQGKIQGLPITGDCLLLQTLFADDTGVIIQATPEYFYNLQEIIQRYEVISGSKLNLQKSVIIPWGMLEIPRWIASLPCKIARKGEVIKYLGYRIGWGIPEEAKKDFLLDKIKLKLSKWYYKTLSFPGKLLAIKHVLKSIPVHVLSALPLQIKSLEELEAACRRFLWGVSKEGKDKIPLLAWKELEKRKNEGGFDVPAFLTMSKCLKLKISLRILQEDICEPWYYAMHEFLKAVRGSASFVQDKSNWSLRKILLADPPQRIPKSSTAQGILKAWNEAYAFLHLKKEDCRLTGWTPTNVFLSVAVKQNWLCKDVARRLKNLLRNLRIMNIDNWSDWALNQELPRPHTRDQDTLIRMGLDLMPQSTDLSEVKWCWNVGGRTYHTWILPAKIRRALFTPINQRCDSLLGKWRDQSSERRWKRRLTKIWKSDLVFADKIWLCRVLQRALPTQQRGNRWGKGDGKCKRCQQDVEDEEHIFWFCTEAKKKWIDFSYIVDGLGIKLQPIPGFLALIDEVLNSQNAAKLFLGLSVLKAIWLERNSISYAEVFKEIPFSVIIQRSLLTIQAIQPITESRKRQIRLQQGEAILTTISQRCTPLGSFRSREAASDVTRHSRGLPQVSSTVLRAADDTRQRRNDRDTSLLDADCQRV